MKTLLKNIGGLVQARRTAPAILKGADMASLPIIQQAWLLIEGDQIVDFGEMKSPMPQAENVVDCQGQWVFPGWCDSHTHMVWAGSRETEFVLRNQGVGYEEIARQGGGILNSAQKLRATSEEELFQAAEMRLKEVMRGGTVAVEIKSGYGLDPESELKMLRVARRLSKTSPQAIKTTFLGAHAIPAEFKQHRDGYVRQIIEEMIPAVVAEGLADYIDVFCDRGFFTPEETTAILEAGRKSGLRAKIHANELAYSGGIQAGVAADALSVDHLEFTGEEEIEVLLNSRTMPTLLPGTAFFLKLHYPPARKMLDAGLPIALASDFNPGSTPSGKMSFVLSLACLYLTMTPEEAINAATINGAYAMDLSETHGSITPGKQASFFLTAPLPSIAYLPYAYGTDLIRDVWVKGEKVVDHPDMV